LQPTVEEEEEEEEEEEDLVLVKPRICQIPPLENTKFETEELYFHQTA
jgi:hypothetical protein